MYGSPLNLIVSGTKADCTKTNGYHCKKSYKLATSLPKCKNSCELPCVTYNVNSRWEAQE